MGRGDRRQAGRHPGEVRAGRRGEADFSLFGKGQGDSGYGWMNGCAWRSGRSGMELGRVTGQVVSTVRDPGLPNLKFLLVDIVDALGSVICSGQVAADILGAGEGEMVLLVRGSSARVVMEARTPLDLSVIGIVDQVTSRDTVFYNK